MTSRVEYDAICQKVESIEKTQIKPRVTHEGVDIKVPGIQKFSQNLLQVYGSALNKNGDVFTSLKDHPQGRKP